LSVWISWWIMGRCFTCWRSSSWTSGTCIGHQFCQGWNAGKRLAIFSRCSQWYLATLSCFLLWSKIWFWQGRQVWKFSSPILYVILALFHTNFLCWWETYVIIVMENSS
jgi:hypothetical protein